MPNPEDIYSSALGAADVSNSTIHVPNIRDSDGNPITPDQYERKLEPGSIVTINVYFKLYCIEFHPYLWSNVLPQMDFEANYTKHLVLQIQGRRRKW